MVPSIFLLSMSIRFRKIKWINKITMTQIRYHHFFWLFKLIILYLYFSYIKILCYTLIRAFFNNIVDGNNIQYLNIKMVFEKQNSKSTCIYISLCSLSPGVGDGERVGENRSACRELIYTVYLLVFSTCPLQRLHEQNLIYWYCYCTWILNIINIFFYYVSVPPRAKPAHYHPCMAYMCVTMTYRRRWQFLYNTVYASWCSPLCTQRII